ncbi:hypothetical protein SAMN05444166_0240 [Singulisphaera sp. GP187]|uniref:hypothetical protein n=1 Tax=Singulisphaera sp. GP187 TaxID=1882752 RepID=UPI0009296428|nr:hypothetical protein [Singulisphaera sp. GP187]SIN70169.1 hypothetical protein SAMN05444166_0240 [Singulisphaera sp. GP187]
MTTLHEHALRLPTFRDGEPCLLSDGQIWTFRTPRVVVEAVAGELGTTLLPRWRLGGMAEVDELFDRLMLARVGFQGDHADHYIQHVLPVAIIQLQGNYHLSQYEAHMRLMPREANTPQEMLDLMSRVATAAVNRPFELLAAVQATMPYQSAEDYRQIEPLAN